MIDQKAFHRLHKFGSNSHYGSKNKARPRIRMRYPRIFYVHFALSRNLTVGQVRPAPPRTVQGNVSTHPAMKRRTSIESLDSYRDNAPHLLYSIDPVRPRRARSDAPYLAV